MFTRNYYLHVYGGVLASALVLGCANAAEKPMPASECFKAAENRKPCYIEINRESPVTELAVRVHPAAGYVSIITAKTPIESLGFDETVSTLAEPDVLAALLKSIRDQLVAFPFKVAFVPPASVASGRPDEPTYTRVLNQLALAGREMDRFSRLADIEAARLSQIAGDLKSVSELRAGIVKWADFHVAACRFVARVTPGYSAVCADRSGAKSEPPSTKVEPWLKPIGPGQLALAKQHIDTAIEEFAKDLRPADGIASEIGKASDALRLATARAEKLSGAAESMIAAADLVGRALHGGAEGLMARRDATPVQTSATSIKATATNQVTKAVAALPIITIRWQHVAWEFSAGLWISELNKRSFKVLPVLNNDGSPATPAQTVLTESSSSKSTAPGFFVHKTMYERQLGSKRVAVMPTAGIGLRDGSAEFVLGGSVAWGDLYASLVRHRGRDVRLTNGLHVGQTNPPAIDGFQEKFGDWKWAVVLSYRVPIP